MVNSKHTITEVWITSNVITFLSVIEVFNFLLDKESDVKEEKYLQQLQSLATTKSEYFSTAMDSKEMETESCNISTGKKHLGT